VGYEALAGRSRSGGRSKLMLQWWSADANGMTQKFGQAMFRRPRELRAGLIALQAVLRPMAQISADTAETTIIREPDPSEP
jgi:hypothetical protein